MSDRIDLRIGSSAEWGDVRLPSRDKLEDLARIVVEWGGPFKLVANDSAVLLEWFELFQTSWFPWPSCEDYWQITLEDDFGRAQWTLEHPTFEELKARCT